jgi:hypothetical protein
MTHMRASCALTQSTLLKIIALQSEIAKFGIDLAGVTTTVVERLPSLTNADGAILEYAEGTEMVYRRKTSSWASCGAYGKSFRPLCE